MSQWTHVTACIRVDDLRIEGLEKGIPDLGEESHPYDDNWVINRISNHKVPCGSEGSLTATCWVNSDKNSLPAYTITVFGDLRDYNNMGEIIEYFKTMLNGHMIRDGVLSIQLDKSNYIFHFSNNEDMSLKIDTIVQTNPNKVYNPHH